jgi:hypothetical protein
MTITLFRTANPHPLLGRPRAGHAPDGPEERDNNDQQ